MPKIVTERLKQNIEAYIVSPNVAKGIWNGDISLILSNKLNNRQAGKLFYLVSEDEELSNVTYGIIKIMPGEKIRKKDLSTLSEFHKLSEQQILKKWPNKQVLYSYKFKLLNVFPTPLKIDLDKKTNIIKNLDKQTITTNIELNKKLFKDIVLSENFISYEGNSIFINKNVDLSGIVIDKLNEKWPFSEYVNFVDGCSDNIIYKLKLERVINNEEPLINLNNELELQTFDFEEDIKELLSDSTKYVVEEMPSKDIIIIQKQDNKISILNKDNTSFELNKEFEESLKMLYGGDYVIKAYNLDKLQVSDCLYFNNESLIDKKWFDRKSKLNSMNFNGFVQKLDSTVVDSIDSVMVATKLRSLNKSDVFIQEWDSTYYNKDKLIKKFILPDVRVHEVYTTNIIEQSLTCQNERFFKSWNSRMAYYLGFIVTDGHVDYENGLVEIMIANEDREILNGLARALGGIAPKPINNSIRLRWRSKIMLEDLKKLGATGKKEVRTSYKKVPSTYTWDFLRGMFDADGNNHKGRLQMDNSCGGSLKWVSKHFKSVAGKDTHLYQYTKHWKSPHYKIVVLGEGAKRLHTKLYSKKPALSRKAKFQGK